MDREKGFISIIALITMAILLAMSLYLANISKMEHLILNAGNNKTQSYYQSEGKIYLALCDDKYYADQLYMNLIDVFRTNKFSTESKKITIDKKDLNFGDNNKDVFLDFNFDKDDRVIMNALATSHINGVKSIVKSSGPIVNELFETNEPIISLDLVEESQKKSLQDLLEIINENISVHNFDEIQSNSLMELDEFNEVILSKKSNRCYEISSKRSNMLNSKAEGFVKNEVFIIAKGKENEKLEFTIGNSEDIENNIKLEGIIFVEGDLIICNDFDFKGIIIVRNGQIINDSKKVCKIEGLLIMDKIEDYDEFININNVVRSRHFIYKYGTYLPGFLDPKITLIKGM